ncbi:MAG: NAD-dependent epimerase/dehydratase family protein [Bacteroidota bacterium]
MILVTGGTGFVGSYLIRYLIDQGQPVRAIKRASSRLDLLGDYADKVDWHTTDLLDLPGLEAAYENVNQVYHCGAMVSFHPKDQEMMDRVNVEGTANMVNIALDRKIDKFLFVSSIAALGRTAHKSHVDESSSWEHSPLNSNYAISKFKSECEVWRGVEEGLNAVVVNPAVVMGSGYWHVGPSEFFMKVDQGLRFYPIGSTAFVDVRDVVRAMTQLMESELSGERFILAGENLSYKDFLEMIAGYMDKSGPSIRVGKFLSEVAWRVEAIKSKITGQLPMVTKETAATSANRFIYDASKVEKALNFNFTPMKATLKQGVQDYLQSKKEGKDHGIMPWN